MAVNRTKVLEAAQKFLAKNQYDKAIAEYQKLVVEDPRDVRTLLKIGDLHTRRNKPQDAIGVYQQVAELYAKQGFFLKAVAVYKQILKLEPSHLESSQQLAKMYEELGLTNDALTTYEQVADAYQRQGAMPKALETMERMVELDGQNVAVRIKYAEALSRAERPRDAALAFAAGARLLKEQGRTDDYLRVVERQLYHDPENVEIARELAGLYIERSDPKRALAKLQVCFKADPRDVPTLEMLAEAFRQLGQLSKTVSVLKEIARLHGELGNHEAKRRVLERVLELDASDAEAKQALAAMGDLGRARKPAATVVADDEHEVELDLDGDEEEQELEYLDADEDDEDEDVLLIDEDDSVPAAAAPAQPSPERLLEEADELEAQGRYDEAEGVILRILASNPNQEEAHERLKDLYLATDRREEAVRELLWLSDTLTESHPERAIQHARAAHGLAPHLDATRNRLRALGVDVEPEPAARAESDDEVVFFDDAGGADASSAGMRDPAEDELDAILPPVSEPPAPHASSAFADEGMRPGARMSSGPPSSMSTVPPAGLSSAPPARASGRPASLESESLLEIVLRPEDFSGAVPMPKRPFDEGLLALLEQPLAPQDFQAGPSQWPEPETVNAADELDALLNAPISPDEFDAPPPSRDRLHEPRMDAVDLLESPIESDDFGLSDERFDRSDVLDFDDSPNALPTVHPPAAVTAQILADSETGSFASFVEVGTSDITVPPPPGDRLDRAREALLEESGEQEAVAPAPDATVPGAPIPADLLWKSSGELDTGEPSGTLRDEMPTAPPPAFDLEPPAASATPTPVPEPEAPPAPVEEHFPTPVPEPEAPPAPAEEQLPTPPPAAAAIAPEIQEVLDEADFFASQGMMDEALEAIQEAILIYPGSDVLDARLLEYEAKAEAQEVAEQQAEAEQPDDSFDIAEQLASELTEVASTGGIDEMVDVESVFAQFKKGVAAQIAPDDSDTHFDLGIAYKEMGLTDDAIQEFDLASKNPKRACTSLTMIGMCYLERGDAQQAVTYFERAINSPQKSALEEMALHYEIGNAQELLGHLDAALSSFERVAAHDRSFRGVTGRLDALRKRGVNAAAAR